MAAEFLSVSHTQGGNGQRCSFPELPLGLSGHSRMKRSHITALPVIVGGDDRDKKEPAPYQEQWAWTSLNDL